MKAEALVALLNELPGVQSGVDETSLQEGVKIESGMLRQVMEYLRHNDNLCFDSLMSQTGVHAGEEIRLFYHLYSYTKKLTMCISTSVPLSEPKIASIAGIWHTGDWLERETYDLLGVIFEGHPDLRRIMLPEEWEGHPLRKDYVTPMDFGGIDNTPPTMERVR